MQLSISLKVLILLFGPYVWLRSMACFENPTCYLCLLGNSTRLSNSPTVILGSSPGEHLSPFDGAKPSSLGKGWLISRSPAFPGANYALPRLSYMPSISLTPLQLTVKPSTGLSALHPLLTSSHITCSFLNYETT